MESVPVVIKPRKFNNYDDLMAYRTEDEAWNKSLGRRFTHHSQLIGVLNNIEDVPESIYDQFDCKVTPYLAQLMDKDDAKCPIRLQYLPTKAELDVKPYEILDSLGEENHTIEGTSIVHRYPKRVLFLVQNTCGAYCRYCTRKRMVSDTSQSIGSDELEASLQYLQDHTEVEDVLLSGGDPLILNDRKLDEILGKIRERAPHVRFLRIGSRLPTQLPTRITPELCEILERHDVNMLNIHINHPKEITPLLRERIKMLRKAGIMLGNQAVLLKGVNDDVETMRELCMQCVNMGVRPYYVYSCDASVGNDQYVVTLKRMLEIYHGLRGWISGPATPTFIVDGVSGLGKMPIQPEYFTFNEDGNLTFTNFEGKSVVMNHLNQN